MMTTESNGFIDCYYGLLLQPAINKEEMPVSYTPGDLEDIYLNNTTMLIFGDRSLALLNSPFLTVPQ